MRSDRTGSTGDRPTRVRKRSHVVGFVLACLASTASVSWLAYSVWRADPQDAAAASPASVAPVAPPVAAAAPAEPMPVPFEEREIRRPAPDDPPVSQTAAYCDERNWSGVHVVRGRAGSEFRVDETEWQESLASARVGLAAYLSQCQQHGGAVTIVADPSGETLARYDPSTGLEPIAR